MWLNRFLRHRVASVGTESNALGLKQLWTDVLVHARRGLRIEDSQSPNEQCNFVVIASMATLLHYICPCEAQTVETPVLDMRMTWRHT